MPQDDEAISAATGKDGSIEETGRFAPRFDASGLMPCIAIDHQTGAVLMLAWVNAQARAGRETNCGKRANRRARCNALSRFAPTATRTRLLTGSPSPIPPAPAIPAVRHAFTGQCRLGPAIWTGPCRLTTPIADQ
jgi:phosphoribosyl-AMP cyclohydrolase